MCRDYLSGFIFVRDRGDAFEGFHNQIKSILSISFLLVHLNFTSKNLTCSWLQKIHTCDSLGKFILRCLLSTWQTCGRISYQPECGSPPHSIHVNVMHQGIFLVFREDVHRVPKISIKKAQGHFSTSYFVVQKYEPGISNKFIHLGWMLHFCWTGLTYSLQLSTLSVSKGFQVQSITLEQSYLKRCQRFLSKSPLSFSLQEFFFSTFAVIVVPELTLSFDTSILTRLCVGAF